MLWRALLSSGELLRSLKVLHLVNNDPDVTRAILREAHSPDISSLLTQCDSSPTGTDTDHSPHFEPSQLQHIGICEEGHQFTFFCSNCNSVFCGNCWVRKHKDELRSHEVLELNDLKVRNTDKIAKSIKLLKEFSGAVDAVIANETRQMHAKEEEFVTFCTEVQRSLMNDTRERYLHRLQASRCEIATAIREDNFEMPNDIVNAIFTQHAQLQRLQAIDKTMRLALDEEAQDVDFSEAVEKALAAIKQNKIQKDLIVSFQCTFVQCGGYELCFIMSRRR